MIPREILQSTSESEVKRQEAIHELIYTEEDYVRDLNLLDDVSVLKDRQEKRAAHCSRGDVTITHPPFSFLPNLLLQHSVSNQNAGRTFAMHYLSTTWRFWNFIAIYTRIFGTIKAHVKRTVDSLIGWPTFSCNMSLDSKPSTFATVPMWYWLITTSRRKSARTFSFKTLFGKRRSKQKLGNYPFDIFWCYR